MLGAHCDDIAIGVGGTLLHIARSNPGVRVHALVLTGAGTEREDEERAALSALFPDNEVRATILGLPDGRVPSHWDEAKDALAEFRRTCEPDIVFAPGRHDAHQDHRTLAELVFTEFRDHVVLGYEILKWESDLPTPVVHQPLTSEVVEQKVQVLHAAYPSQVDRDWFDRESFFGLARLRGVQCKARYAEAFVVEKCVVDFGGAG